MTGHDLLCPDGVVCDEGGGWLCDLVADARIDGISRALEAVDTGGRAASQLQALLAQYGRQTGDAA